MAVLQNKSKKKTFSREQYPARGQCLELLHEHNASVKVIAHSEKVTEVALYLAKKLKAKGENIDAGLVEAGALLHDLGRASAGVERHHHRGHELLLPKWPAVAEIVRSHMLEYIVPPNSLPDWESKLVFYADKRVTGSEIVSLDERFSYLRARYGVRSSDWMKLINDAHVQTEMLEREIFNKIGADVSLGVLVHRQEKSKNQAGSNAEK